jgi:hypothetical protein
LIVHAIGIVAVTEHQKERRRTLTGKRRLQGDRIMRAVSSDEVHQRFWMLQVLNHIGPARIGLHPGVAGLRIEVPPRRVESRNPGVAATRKVEHGEVEGRA